MTPYSRIQIERVKAPEWMLPVEVEPESVPMFAEVEL